MQKKGAIALSINMIVIIIISLVILGAGITLLYQWIGVSEDIKADLDEQTDRELERLLIDRGKPVVLASPVANLYPGNEHLFGIGILNMESGDINDQFQITTKLSKFVDQEGNDQTTEVKEKAEAWLFYDTETLTILEHEHQKKGIFVNVDDDAQKGQYIFNVQVIDGNGIQYGNLQKFTVNVQ